jgi:hypothetical protein
LLISKKSTKLCGPCSIVSYKLQQVGGDNIYYHTIFGQTCYGYYGHKCFTKIFSNPLIIYAYFPVLIESRAKTWILQVLPKRSSNETLSSYSALGKSLCTYKRYWKWCPRGSTQVGFRLILFANTFCRSLVIRFLCTQLLQSLTH